MNNSAVTDSDKNFYIAWALCAIGGMIGLHFFYVGRFGAGFLRILLTFFLVGLILWLVDIFKIYQGDFEDKNGNKLMNYKEWLAQSSYNKHVLSKTGASAKDEEKLADEERELLNQLNNNSEETVKDNVSENNKDKEEEEDIFKNI